MNTSFIQNITNRTRKYHLIILSIMGFVGVSLLLGIIFYFVRDTSSANLDSISEIISNNEEVAIIENPYSSPIDSKIKLEPSNIDPTPPFTIESLKDPSNVLIGFSMSNVEENMRRNNINIKDLDQLLNSIHKLLERESLSVNKYVHHKLTSSDIYYLDQEKYNLERYVEEEREIDEPFELKNYEGEEYENKLKELYRQIYSDLYNYQVFDPPSGINFDIAVEINQTNNNFCINYYFDRDKEVSLWNKLVRVVKADIPYNLYNVCFDINENGDLLGYFVTRSNGLYSNQFVEYVFNKSAEDDGIYGPVITEGELSILDRDYTNASEMEENFGPSVDEGGNPIIEIDLDVNNWIEFDFEEKGLSFKYPKELNIENDGNSIIILGKYSQILGISYKDCSLFKNPHMYISYPSKDGQLNYGNGEGNDYYWAPSMYSTILSGKYKKDFLEKNLGLDFSQNVNIDNDKEDVIINITKLRSGHCAVIVKGYGHNGPTYEEAVARSEILSQIL